MGDFDILCLELAFSCIEKCDSVSPIYQEQKTRSNGLKDHVELKPKTLEFIITM